MRVIAFPVSIESQWGLDVAILQANATVEDLAQALQPASDNTKLYKEWRRFSQSATHGTCWGCTYCCERFNIYLSRIDVLNMAAAEGVSPAEFMAFLTAYEPWLIDRIRLSDPQKYCLRSDGLGCNKYEARPLICRLYICCPHTEAARQLLAAVNRWAEEDLVNWRNGRTDSSNPFSGRFTYDQVRLHDCVRQELWQKLYRPAGRARLA